MKSISSLQISVAAVVLTFATGCSSLCDLRDPVSGVAIPKTFSGTVADTKSPKSISPTPVLKSVETVNCDGFDRVVFTFEGTQTPGYFVEYIDRPVRACGSGEVVPVAGDGYLEIRMTPAQAHTDSGEVTVAERNRTFADPNSNLLQLVDTCDFEGNVTWVLGLSSPGPYRVVALSEPPRLVLDVKR